MNTTIICGFPGVGKTTASYTPDGDGCVTITNVLDMESSAYSWIFDSFQTPVRNPEFPKNYIDSLESFARSGVYEYIFMSCHEEVRQELKKRGIKYIIIAPRNTVEIKNEYCKRYLRRGSHVDFISKMYRDWDAMISSIEADDAPTIWLDSGEYLADVLSKEGE